MSETSSEIMSEFKQLSRSVAGSRVLVTGAASGMGRATARGVRRGRRRGRGDRSGPGGCGTSGRGHLRARRPGHRMGARCGRWRCDPPRSR